MRLTLRTLLAYRDRVLSESDLSDLHKRIQQSEMAGNLLRRMDALSLRQQLLAPRVDGRGLGGDANSVAEYLDDILEREKVPELERVCLESDVQLAELTQCHALLSTALNTSVDVPDLLRDRVVGLLDSGRRAIETEQLIDYPSDSVGEGTEATNVSIADRNATKSQLKRLDAAHPKPTFDVGTNQPGARPQNKVADSADQATAVADSRAVQSPMVASGGQSIRPTGLDLEGSQLAHEVPEYLRGRSRDGWRGPLAIGALAATLALLIWYSLGPWESVKQMFVARAPVGQLADSSSRDIHSGGMENVGGDPRDQPKNGAGVATDNKGSEANVRRAEPQTADNSNLARNTDASGIREASPSPTNISTSQPPEPSRIIAPSPNPPLAPLDNPTIETAPPAVAWLPVDAHEKRAILLTASDGVSAVTRIAPAQTLPSGSRIVVPPAVRATLDLAQQLRWTICGPTKMLVRTDEKDAHRPPSVELSLGRALLASGPNARTVELLTNSWKGTLTLSGANGMAAIELSYRPLTSGTVIDQRAFVAVLTITSVEGEVSVVSQSAEGKLGETLILKVGEGIGMVGTMPYQRFLLKEVPAWYRGIAERPIDVQAADDLHRMLADDPKVHEKLIGLLLSRRPETAALAAQTLAMFGRWDGIAGPASLLNSVSARSHWTTTLDLVRQIIAAEPLHATQVRSAFTDAEPTRGNLLCDLLLGLPEERLKTDAVEVLVGLLESEFLNERVLASYQIRLLTGRDFGYQAHDVDRTVVQHWRRELANKRIRVIAPAQPLWESK